MIDMTNNRVPYGLLTDEEKAALHEHKKAGGEFLNFRFVGGDWTEVEYLWCIDVVYRTAPLPKTQDVIAWDRLPDWLEWVARNKEGLVYAWAYEPTVFTTGWDRGGNPRRIDDFPGIVQIGTCDWKDSLQRRPE